MTPWSGTGHLRSLLRLSSLLWPWPYGRVPGSQHCQSICWCCCSLYMITSQVKSIKDLFELFCVITNRNILIKLDYESTDLFCCQKLHWLMYHSLSLSLSLSLIPSQNQTQILSPWSQRWQIRCQSGSLPALAAGCRASRTKMSCHRREHLHRETPPETRDGKPARDKSSTRTSCYVKDTASSLSFVSLSLTCWWFSVLAVPLFFSPAPDAAAVLLP